MKQFIAIVSPFSCLAISSPVHHRCPTKFFQFLGRTAAFSLFIHMHSDPFWNFHKIVGPLDSSRRASLFVIRSEQKLSARAEAWARARARAKARAKARARIRDRARVRARAWARDGLSSSLSSSLNLSCQNLPILRRQVFLRSPAMQCEKVVYGFSRSLCLKVLWHILPLILDFCVVKSNTRGN